jgi:hypothetical protein
MVIDKCTRGRGSIEAQRDQIRRNTARQGQYVRECRHRERGERSRARAGNLSSGLERGGEGR